MANHVTCERCGANLDFGERCDCRRARLADIFSDIPDGSPLLTKLLEMGEEMKKQQKTAPDATTSKGRHDTIIHPNDTQSIHQAGAKAQEGGI